MKGRGFAGLARYLEIGREGDSPDRVAWIEARNLPTRDPHTASLIMRATAAQSARVERPVYHIALSFDPDDGVDRATMIRVADRLLNDLGIREHQSLIVAHGDRQHPHVHLMINRVHPETFRAWDPKHDYARIERSLREQERELTLRAVPGHHYQLDGHQRPDRSDALTSGQLRRWDRTGEMPFDEIVRPTVRQDVASAQSWEQLEMRLAEKGLRLEPRGRGFVLTDGQEEMKASSVAPELSRRNLEQRFGAMHGERQDPEERPIARGHAQPAQPSERAADAATGDPRTIAQPPRSAEASGATDNERTGRAAANAGRDRTEAGVHDRPASSAGRSDRVDSDGRDRPGADRGNARRRGSGTRDPQLDAVRQTFHALERRLDREKVRDNIADQLDRAHSRLAPLEAQRAEAREASRRLETALSRVYRDPATARREFETHARESGQMAAIRLGRHPERFGELRGTQIGPVRSQERNDALRVAGNLRRLGADHVRGLAQTSATQDQYRGLKTFASALDQRVKQLDAELARGPGSATLRHRLGHQLHALRPGRRQALRRSLPISHRRLFTAALTGARSFANEQGHER